MQTENPTEHALLALFNSSATPAEYAAGFFGRLADVMERIDMTAVGKLVEMIESAQAADHSIFMIGNGGSAAVASHFVNDLCPNALVGEGRGFRAFCLADNVESVTAIANDTGFEHVFSHQLQCSMVPGDLVVALSVSGNSPNIVRAMEFARDNGGKTAGVVGMEGGRLAQIADHVVHVSTTGDEYGPAEDVFSNVSHVVTGYLTMKRGGKLYH